jgi:hypothetical protein
LPEFDEISKRIRTGAKISDKLSVQNLIDIFRDNWGYIIRSELQAQFTEKTYKKMYWLTSQEQNIVKRVVNELSVVYKQPAERLAVKDDSGENIIYDENYQEAIKDTDLDAVMQMVNKYTNLTNQTLLKVVFRDGKLDFDLINFNNAEIYTHMDDWRKIVAIKYFVGYVFPQKYYTSDDPKKVSDQQAWITETGPLQEYSYAYIYTFGNEDLEIDGTEILESDARKFLKGGKIYKVSAASDKTEVIVDEKDNPYRDENGDAILPFVFCPKQYPVEELLDFTTGSDLFDLNINVALDITHLNNLKKYQSYKQPVLRVPDTKGLPPVIRTDPTEPIILQDPEGNAQAYLLDLQARIKEHQETIEKRILSVLTGYGISPQNYTMSATPESGFALKISNMGKLEAREQQLPNYLRIEKDLFDVTRAVWNHHMPGKEISEDSQLMIDFAELEYPLSPQEKMTKQAWLKQNNVITDLDIMLDNNPDLSEEQAKKLLEENKAMNGMVGGPDELDVIMKTQNGESKPVEMLNLNGAQITAATTIIESVAAGKIPRDSGVNQLKILFNLTDEQANSLMGKAGKDIPQKEVGIDKAKLKING